MALETVADSKLCKITRQTHTVDLPALCPKTGNPQPGSTITISYEPRGRLLEVYSLQAHIAAFVGHPEIRDIEVFTQAIARDCERALFASVKVTGKFILDIGQTVICECWS